MFWPMTLGKFICMVQFRHKAIQSALQGNKITSVDINNKQEDIEKKNIKRN